MKAKGVYVYGVWCEFTDPPHTKGWASVFYQSKYRAAALRRDLAKNADVIVTIKRVYIPAPKEAK